MTVPVEASWLIDKRMMLLHFAGVVTLDDVAVAGQLSSRFIRDGTAPVHLITDTTAVEKFPSLLELRRVAGRETIPGTGWQIIVVTNPVLRFLTSVLTQLAGTQFRLVSTRQDAVDFLISRDLSLPARRRNN